MAFFEDYGSNLKLEHQRSKGVNYAAAMHLHPHYEALLVLSDIEQSTTINGQLLPTISEASLTIFAPFVMHRTSYQQDIPSERLVFYFGSDFLSEFAVSLKLFEAHSQAVFSRFSISRELLDTLQPQIDILRQKPQDPVLQRLATCMIFYQIIKNARLELTWNQVQSLEKINAIIRYMSEHCQENLSSEDICAKFYISRSKLNKDFSRYFSITFHELLIEMKLSRAYFMLSGKQSIKDIAQQMGFEKDTYFYTFFKKYTGYTPLQWRKARKSGVFHATGAFAGKLGTSKAESGIEKQ